SFSSLMFLSTSPPRLTRRSRLDNLWLLLLRMLALLLIAIAFMRPFLRQDQLLNTTLSGRRIVLVIDTSGSMQRADVWAAAQRIAAEVLADLSPTDHVALYSIDRELTALLPLDDLGNAAPDVTQHAAKEALALLEPTWQPTELAEGLKSLADLIVSQSISDSLPPGTNHEVVLISDLHSGIRLEGLQGFAWPGNINLDVRQALPSQAGNAHLSLLQEAEDGPTQYTADDARPSSVGSAPATWRVRVENDSDAQTATLQLSWADANGPLPGRTTGLQIPPGQVRVVPLGERPASADRIGLQGDAWDGDNTLYLIQPTRTTRQIVFCGTSQSLPEEDLSYFLKQAPLSSPLVRREVVVVAVDELPEHLKSPDTCAVVLEPTAAVLEHSAEIQRFADLGGVVLLCLSRPVAGNRNGIADIDDLASFLRDLLQEASLSVREGGTEDFSLLAKIDFTHPVFAPLSDPRFNDFSKLRFWSHRQVALPAETEVHTVASFDNQSPLLLEARRGNGRVWLLTAGWQPTASSLGLSTKFVPILMGLVDPQTSRPPLQLSYAVGDTIEVSDPQQVVVTTAQSEPVDKEQVVRHGQSIELRRPGLFWLQDGEARRQIAVQVPVSESRLVPLDVSQLEQYGIAVGQLASDVRRRESMRQMQREELESKQRLWQWLLVACLVVLAVETWLAGWQSR
ncbi:MAG: VWA domain-containing protein, partial [Planctomycetales bacterium]|nr:VWA domain-containing protein [Planctomycetales bacterium]